MIELPAGTKIWIAAGVTDMRRGFDGLSAQVQTVLQEQAFSGHVFIFRGRRGEPRPERCFDLARIEALLEIEIARLHRGLFVGNRAAFEHKRGALGHARLVDLMSCRRVEGLHQEGIPEL